MGTPLPPVPANVLAPGVLRDYLLKIKEPRGDAVADTSDVSDTATQLNDLLAELRSIGIIRK